MPFLEITENGYDIDDSDWDEEPLIEACWDFIGEIQDIAIDQMNEFYNGYEEYY